MALAGSAPRGETEEEDRRLGSELLASQKNRAEHEFVTAMLRDSLGHLCSKTWIADTPELLRLKNIQHLQTAIVGELLPDRSILEALDMLHPTPAVGGTPTASALAFIRAYENLDRGWYAGPIGWIDLQGNGEFAVALRSALLESRRATLFAGCGIVKDSDPEAEYAESCLKLQVILRSLSGEE
jgi:isochorismate synthase